MGDKDIDDFNYVETNQCISVKHSTPFGLNYDMDQMKDMVRDADPGTVTRVAEAWEALSKDLVGPGGIKESLDAAVEHVLAHWEGQSADLFRQRAQVISTKITDSSKYASNASVSLRGAAAKLAEIKPEVMAMEKPGKVSSALDYIGNMGDRDDSGANNALKSGEGSQAALDGNAGSLSEGREAQLRMAVKMEALGAAYNSRAAEMGYWKPGNGIDHADDYPGDPGGVAPAPVVVPTETSTRSPQRVTASTGRTAHTSTIGSSKAVTPPSGITGGAHKPTVSQPQVGTAIDGISGGRTGAPSVAGGAGTVGGGSAAGGGIGGGAGFVGGAVGGAAGAGAARGGLIGRAGAGAGVGGAAGRAGAGGVGGAGAAKGAAGRVGGTARGGVVGGTPKSGTGAGRGTAGGSGLHNSRGAAGKGASAVRKGGIAGAPGSRTGRRKEDEQHEGERPDYLVEDEETWTPQTNAAPRVIE
ncbi:WXG100 family type VII secretion target [Streptomyces griseorubiginosus]|uniref:WXG100 family type VII secretion target n=1 Tax=Streptomyces griseorubiginosus TaxID=67304 RepID=UPI0036294EAF